MYQFIDRVMKLKQQAIYPISLLLNQKTFKMLD